VIEVEHEAAMAALFVAAAMRGGTVNMVYAFGDQRVAGYCVLSTRPSPAQAAFAPWADRITLCWRESDRMFGEMRIGDMGKDPMPTGRIDRGLGAVHV
jgi:hypothetical protein